MTVDDLDTLRIALSKRLRNMPGLDVQHVGGFRIRVCLPTGFAMFHLDEDHTPAQWANAIIRHFRIQT
jgi:hypothetical protein